MFALWLAPRLEAQGYRFFADILSFEAGDRWRKKSGDYHELPDIIFRPLATSEDVLPYNAVWLTTRDQYPVAQLRQRVEEITADALNGISGLIDDFMAGYIEVF